MSDSVKIYEKLKEIIVGSLCINENRIQENTDLLNDLGADSLDMVEIIMAIEEEFGVAIPNDAIESIKTMSELVDFVSENKK